MVPTTTTRMLVGCGGVAEAGACITASFRLEPAAQHYAGCYSDVYTTLAVVSRCVQWRSVPSQPVSWQTSRGCTSSAASPVAAYLGLVISQQY